MDLVPPGFISISEAYEKIVTTLEPRARPTDDHLLSLDEKKRDSAFDTAHDAEKRAEKLFSDALENGQLTRCRMLNGTMVRGIVRDEWKPSALGIPGLDSHSPDFTDSSDGDGSMVCIDEGQLNRWLHAQRAAEKDTAPSDRWELNVGDSLIERIQSALTSAGAILVILSANSVASEWCKKELNVGLIREL